MRRDYAKPFADLFRPLTAAERAELRASIEAHGVRYAAKVYLSDRHGWAVIDGANRLDVCGELDIDCPVEDLGELNEDTARDLAEQLNHARRHLTPDDWRQMAAKAAKRRQRVVEKRKEGKSLRTIADEEGVNVATIHRDLKESGVDGSTGDGLNVTGKDGKQYSATKPADDIGDTLDLFDAPADDEPVSQGDGDEPDNSTQDQSEQTPASHQYTPPRKGKPPPPRPEYPEPMGSILDDLTALAGKITRFLNSDLAEAVKIKEYVGICKLGWVNYTRAKIVVRNGTPVKTNPNWRAFQAVRALFRQGYRDRNLKKPRTEQFLKELMNEEGGDVLEGPNDGTAEE